MVEDAAVVETAAAAAEDVVFSRLSTEAIRDFDVTVTFEEGILEIDVYVDADDPMNDPERVADDAAVAARKAADDLLEGD